MILNQNRQHRKENLLLVVIDVNIDMCCLLRVFLFRTCWSPMWGMKMMVFRWERQVYWWWSAERFQSNIINQYLTDQSECFYLSAAAQATVMSLMWTGVNLNLRLEFDVDLMCISRVWCGSPGVWWTQVWFVDHPGVHSVISGVFSEEENKSWFLSAEHETSVCSLMNLNAPGPKPGSATLDVTWVHLTSPEFTTSAVQRSHDNHNSCVIDCIDI